MLKYKKMKKSGYLVLMFLLISTIISCNEQKRSSGQYDQYDEYEESSYSSEDEYSTDDYYDSSSNRIVFNSKQDVMVYLSSRSFSSGGNVITFEDQCMYGNGQCFTGAINVIDFNSTQAILEAYSPLIGGNIRFKVDNESNILTDLNTGDVYQ